MFSNIKRAIENQMQTKGATGDLDPERIRELVNSLVKSKAEQDDLRSLQHAKANKVDADICLRWVDLLHRMLKAVLQVYAMHL